MPATVLSYDAKMIYQELQTTLYGAFATFQGASINSRYMLFASTGDLRTVYLMTHLSSDKCQELRANPNATLSVLSTRAQIEDVSQTVIIGRVVLLDDFRDPEVQQGLKLLAARNAMIQMIVDGGSLGAYCLMKIKVERVDFGVYRDLVRELPKTTLRFA